MSGWLIGCQMDFRKKSPWSSSLYGRSQLWKGWKHASLHPAMQAEQLFHLSGYHLWKSKTLTCMLPHLRSVFCSLVQIVSPWIFLGLKWFPVWKVQKWKVPKYRSELRNYCRKINISKGQNISIWNRQKYCSVLRYFCRQIIIRNKAPNIAVIFRMDMPMRKTVRISQWTAKYL